MLEVLAALSPVIFAAVYFEGFSVLAPMLICAAAAYSVSLVIKRDIYDFSPLVSGLLLSFCLPPDIPLWLCVLGGAAAMVLREFFGGLGRNPANPALFARALLSFLYPAAVAGADALSGATPLALARTGHDVRLIDMFTGNISGMTGEVSAAAILIGGIYLCVRGIINPAVPAVFILGCCSAAWLCGGDPLYNALGGGLMLAAFFMITDYASSPVTPAGKIIFAATAGVLTGLLRSFGPANEYVCYCVLLMNTFSPLAERLTIPKYYGSRVKKIAKPH